VQLLRVSDQRERQDRAIVNTWIGNREHVDRSLFRGRADVFPTRFVSRRTGKPGYAPACRNKFVRGICELPQIKCGECASKAFFQFAQAQGDVRAAVVALKEARECVELRARIGAELRTPEADAREPHTIRAEFVSPEGEIEHAPEIPDSKPGTLAEPRNDRRL